MGDDRSAGDSRRAPVPGRFAPTAPDGRAVPPNAVRLVRDVMATVIEVGPGVTQLLGWRPDELVGTRMAVHPDDVQEAVTTWAELVGGIGIGTERSWRGRSGCRDGSWRWIESRNVNLLDEAGCGHVVSELWPVDDEEAASHEMSRLHEQLFERVTEAIPIGLFQFDHAGRIAFVNDRLQSWLGGAAPATLADLGASLTDTDREVFTTHIASTLGGSSLDAEEVRIAADGRVCTLSLRSLRDAGGRVNGGVGCLSDVTERVRLRDELERRANTDQLTGAANRAASFTALQDWLDAGLAITVAFVDLDDFKSINDHHGHAAGDDALVALAARLRAVCRDDDLVGRLGGDEFVVVSRGSADALAGRIADALAAPIEVAGGHVQLSASIGLATGTRRSDTADTLLDRADAAMYARKRSPTERTDPSRRRASPDPERRFRSGARRDGRADLIG